MCGCRVAEAPRDGYVVMNDWYQASSGSRALTLNLLSVSLDDRCVNALVFPGCTSAEARAPTGSSSMCCARSARPYEAMTSGLCPGMSWVLRATGENVSSRICRKTAHRGQRRHHDTLRRLLFFIHKAPWREFFRNNNLLYVVSR